MELYDVTKQGVPVSTDRVPFRNADAATVPEQAANCTVVQLVAAGVERTASLDGVGEMLKLGSETTAVGVFPLLGAGMLDLGHDAEGDFLAYVQPGAVVPPDRVRYYRRTGAAAYALWRTAAYGEAVRVSGMTAAGVACDYMARGEQGSVIGDGSNLVEYTWHGPLPAPVLDGAPIVGSGSSLSVELTVVPVAGATGYTIFRRANAYWGWYSEASSGDGKFFLELPPLGGYDLAVRVERNAEAGPITMLTRATVGDPAPGGVLTPVFEQNAAGCFIHFTTAGGWTDADCYLRKVGALGYDIETAEASAGVIELGALGTGNYEAWLVSRNGEASEATGVPLTWRVRDPDLVLSESGPGVENIAAAALAAAGSGGRFYGPRDLAKWAQVGVAPAMEGGLCVLNMGARADATLRQIKVPVSGSALTVDLAFDTVQLGSDHPMIGVGLTSATGDGVLVSAYSSGTSIYTGLLSAGIHSGVMAAHGYQGAAVNGAGRAWLRLRKSGTSYYAAWSMDGQVWSGELSMGVSAVAVTEIRVGQFLKVNGAAPGTLSHKMALRWVAVRPV